MKMTMIALAAALAGFGARAATHYVDASFTGTSDGSAAAPWTTIQAGIDAAASGDTVMVAPGVYGSGVTDYARVSIKKNLKLISSAGRERTVVDGSKQTGCVNVANDMEVEIRGFTFANGNQTSKPETPLGGGLSCWTGTASRVQAQGVKVYDCAITNCTAGRAGGVFGGVYVRCLFADNYLGGFSGIHATGATLVNCIVSGGFDKFRLTGCRIVNCTLLNGCAGSYYLCGANEDTGTIVVNSVLTDGGGSSGTSNMVSCLTESAYKMLTPWSGDGCGYKLFASSPLVDAGNAVAYTNYATAVAGISAEELATDFNGEPRFTDGKIAVGAVQGTMPDPDAGCLKFTWAAGDSDSTSELSLDGKPLTTFKWSGNTFRVYAAGWPQVMTLRTKPLTAGYVFNSMVIGGKMFAPPDPNAATVEYKIAVPRSGELAVAPVNGKPVYAEAGYTGGGSDGSAGKPWTTLADAVAAASNSCPVILVCPGTYDQGTMAYCGTNRLVVTKANTCIRSTGGAGQTFIAGASDPLGSNGNGPGAVRPVAFSSAVSGLVQGFTLTGGRTTAAGTAELDWNGGGAVQAQYADAYAMVADCVITNCRASKRGAAGIGGTLDRCTIVNCNRNAGAIDLFDGADLISCLIERNTSLAFIAGKAGATTAERGILLNCTMVSNSCTGTYPIDRVIACNTLFTGNKGSGGAVDAPANIYATNCLLTAVAGYAYSNSFELAVADPQLAMNAGGEHAYVKLCSAAIGHGDAQYLQSVYDVDGVEFPISADGKMTAGCSGRIATTLVKPSVNWPGGSVVAPAGEFAVLEPTDVTLTAQTGLARNLIGFVANGVTNAATGGSCTVRLEPSGDTGTPTYLDVTALYRNWFFVDAVGGLDTDDGLTEDTAWRTLQHAVDACAAYDIVIALPGEYRENTGAFDGFIGEFGTNTLASRVVINKALTLRSRAGAGTTFIVGQDATVCDGTDTYDLKLGTNAVRCAVLGNNARVEGFTFTGGRTMLTDELNLLRGERANGMGGAVYAMNQTDATCVDCIFSNNHARTAGACYGGWYTNCWFIDNAAVADKAACYRVRAYQGLFAKNRGPHAFCASQGWKCTVAADNMRFDGSQEDMVWYGTHYDCIFAGEQLTVSQNKNYNCLVDSIARVKSDVTVSNFVFGATDLDENYRPRMGANAGIDAATNGIELLEAELGGGQRVYNGVADLGCFETDWRPTYNRHIFAGGGTAVTAAEPVVTEAEVDGTAAVALNGGELRAIWSHPRLKSFFLRYYLDAGGSISVTRNGEAVPGLTYAAGWNEVKVASAAECTDNLVFTGDGAYLAGCAVVGGSMIIIR